MAHGTCVTIRSDSSSWNHLKTAPVLSSSASSASSASNSVVPVGAGVPPPSPSTGGAGTFAVYKADPSGMQYVTKSKVS